MASIDSFDAAGLDRFIDEMLHAGFDAVPGSTGKKWTGPIADCLREFTDAEVMTIHLRDGWPLKSPQVTVKGLRLPHTGHDIVCLWRPDDMSREWMHFAGVLQRIDEFCERARRGFDEVDEMLDAWLAFEDSDLAMVTFDLEGLKAKGFTDGQFEECKGIVRHDYLIEVTSGKASRSAGNLRGRWYYRENISVPPPSLKGVKAHLTGAQLKNLERGLERLRADQDGAVDFALLMSRRASGQIEAVAVRFTVDDEEVKSASMQPAPVDKDTLLLRAGPDASELQDKTVALFGVGAIGGHVAMLLSESGAGKMTLVDGDRLRPSNVVRHVVGDHAVGFPKALATSAEIERHAPWTGAQVRVESPMAPAQLRSIIDGADLVVECTGDSNVAEALSRVCHQQQMPFITAALYRQGTVGRVRRQLPGDLPIPDRETNDDYPLIPQSDIVYLGLEIGCSTPVINAPPISCALLGALTAKECVTVLTDRSGDACEHIFVLEADENLDPPFERPGVYSYPH